MIPLAEIQVIVARQFRLTKDELLSHKRARRFSRPRMIAMALAREYTEASTSQIGKVFKRDHTTVIGASKRFPELRKLFPNHVAAIRAKIAYAAELRELDNLSGIVALCAEQQVQWAEREKRFAVRHVQKRRKKAILAYADSASHVNFAYFRPGVPIPSAFEG